MLSYFLILLFKLGSIFRRKIISKSLLNHARNVSIFCVSFVLVCICIIFCSIYRDPFMRLSPNSLKYLIYEDVTDLNSSLDVKKLKLKLEKINRKHKIANTDKYIPMDDDTPIIIVQVHKDVKRLQCLIVSLAQVRDINSILLIFSHSFYHETIDHLIRSIDYCKVMQIYYPYSLQLNPYRFPGIDVDDCPPGTKTTGYCANRDARITEHKQHWWWKANFVFHRLARSKTHNAPVIFLEENNYVAPDLLHMLQYVQRSLLYFPHVEVMSFGRPLTKNIDTDLLILEPWRPPFDVGLAFNKTTWNNVLSLSTYYCMYNDRSWSYSLFNLFKKFPNGFANMIACMNPRVLSTMEFTDSKNMLKKFSSTHRNANLFPEKVKAVYLFGRNGRVERVIRAPPMGSGGWNDLRDQVLCLDPLFSTTTEEKRYYDA